MQFKLKEEKYCFHLGSEMQWHGNTDVNPPLPSLFVILHTQTNCHYQLATVLKWNANNQTKQGLLAQQ